MNLINHEEVQFPGLGIKFNVDPVAFRIGNFEVYWYGILIAAALVVCIVLALKQAKKNNFPDTLVYDTMLVTIPCAIIGARAYYVIFNWNIYKESMLKRSDEMETSSSDEYDPYTAVEEA